MRPIGHSCCLVPHRLFPSSFVISPLFGGNLQSFRSMASSSSSSQQPPSGRRRRDVFTELEHTNWQRGVDAYAKGFGPLTVQAVPVLLDRVGLGSCEEGCRSESSGGEEGGGVRLLDVACGPGQVLEALHAKNLPRHYSYTGLDFSSEFLELAKRNWKNWNSNQNNIAVTWLEGDAQNLHGLEDETFDALVCNFGILHLADPDAFLREAFRVLTPGGSLAFSAWAAPPQTEGFALILDAVHTRGNPSVPLPDGPPFFRFANPAEIRASLEAAGFTGVDTTVVESMEWTNMHTAEELFEAFLEGTARTRELLKGQTAEETLAVREELAEKFGALVGNPPTRSLRMPAVVSSGRKPSSKAA